mmetsp:Transcript_34267/g.71337  ORF Transcript_34267/g.71337 Transcript_34267/m.71337 type:complete len:317 (+) Transcript_34267:1126-2076(+)
MNHGINGIESAFQKASHRLHGTAQQILYDLGRPDHLRRWRHSNRILLFEFLHVNQLSYRINTTIKGHGHDSHQGDLWQQVVAQNVPGKPIKSPLSGRHTQDLTRSQMILEGGEDGRIGKTGQGQNQNIRGRNHVGGILRDLQRFAFHQASDGRIVWGKGGVHIAVLLVEAALNLHRLILIGTVQGGFPSLRRQEGRQGVRGIAASYQTHFQGFRGSHCRGLVVAHVIGQIVVRGAGGGSEVKALRFRLDRVWQLGCDGCQSHGSRWRRREKSPEKKCPPHRRPQVHETFGQTEIGCFFLSCFVLWVVTVRCGLLSI